MCSFMDLYYFLGSSECLAATFHCRFYCKLNGGSLLDVQTMQKYANFAASPAADRVDRGVVEGMYRLSKTLGQIGSVDSDIKEAEAKLIAAARPQ